MRKFIFICLAACLGLMGCEKDNVNERVPLDYAYTGFHFMVCDANGNCVFDKENIDMDELTLEYMGQTFNPILDVEQKIDKGDGYNSLIFDPHPHTYMIDDAPVTWVIYGHLLWGESARYILRYKDNEWVCDFSSDERAVYGELPETELYVNGEKVEKIYAYTMPDHPDYESDEQRNVWVYPLYVK